MDSARVCAYDKNLSNGTSQILKNGRTEVCDLTDSSGTFQLQIVNEDPDDNTFVDLRIGVLLENDDVSTMRPDGSVYHYVDDTRDNFSQSIVNVGSINAPASFYGLYSDFAGIVKTHKFFNDQFSYDIPFVTLEETAHTPTDFAVYCEGNDCGTVQNSNSSSF